MKLDDGIVALKMMMESTLREVITASVAQRATKKADALIALVTHIANNWKAVCILNEHDDDGLEQVVANPTAVLSRCMYDALLQALYIAVDSAKAEERATEYLEFSAVEYQQFVERVLKGTSSLSRQMAQSPRRASAEHAIRKEYDRVKGRYTNKRGSIRQHWYPGNLRELARSVGKDEEYSWYVTYSNSSVHAGPFSVVKGPLGTAGDRGLFAVAAIACQAATLLTKELHINVSKENEAFMTQFSKDPCNWSPTT